MKTVICLALLGLAIAAPAAAEGGDPKAGASKVATCSACHGAEGSNPTAPIYPKLAGQYKEYLESALRAYREGLREGGMAAMMTPQATTLSDADIADIAAYYSELDPVGKSGGADPAEQQPGG